MMNLYAISKVSPEVNCAIDFQTSKNATQWSTPPSFLVRKLSMLTKRLVFPTVTVRTSGWWMNPDFRPWKIDSTSFTILNDGNELRVQWDRIHFSWFMTIFPDLSPQIWNYQWKVLAGRRSSILGHSNVLDCPRGKGNYLLNYFRQGPWIRLTDGRD